MKIKLLLLMMCTALFANAQIKTLKQAKLNSFIFKSKSNSPMTAKRYADGTVGNFFQRNPTKYAELTEIKKNNSILT